VRFNIAAFVGMALIAASCFGQEVIVKPYNVYHALVYDPTLIEEFRQGQMLEPDLKIDSIEVIDATRNGFGIGDLIVVYPSKQIFHLMTIEEPLRSIMSSWTYDANKLYSAPFTTSAELQNSARELQSPYAGLLSFLLRGLELYYPAGEYIEGFFRKDKETSFIELWNFDEARLNYRESARLGVSDTLKLFDILKVEANDTVFLSDSTLYDAIYIYKTITDTIFVPQEAH
jgi:hypothetical protein